jgi:predicted RNA binding protein YcfA (HicA-like mRNA interferase family)
MMKKVFKISEVLKVLKEEGWYPVSQEGSHRQFEHATKSGQVTVAGKPSEEIHPKTLKSILRQAGLSLSNLSKGK